MIHMEKALQQKKQIVGIGSVRAAIGPAEFSAYAIGSCIALCLYDAKTGVGGMAHILLPAASYTGHENEAIDINTKYADHALQAALTQMGALGAKASRLRAAIIGGATMFPHGDMAILNIGEMNIASVQQELSKAKVPLVYTVTGGTKSRTVKFSIPGESFEQQIRIMEPKLSL